MKRIICMAVYSLLILNFTQAKELPEFVQQRLDSVKKEIQKSLTYYRVWDGNIDGYMTLPRYLRYGVFSDAETHLIDSLGLNLSIEMVYDDVMRNRILQLLRNEYEEWELDSLVNRRITGYYRAISYEKDVMDICKFDTLPIFRQALDSFFIDMKQKSINDNDTVMYKKYIKNEPFYKEENRYNVFKLLKLDTTAIFKQTHQNLVERERERERKYYTGEQNRYSYSGLSELCGYIDDKRFIQPLIEMLDNEKEDFRKEEIIESLVRMRVEPYYSDYIKSRTRTLEQVQNEEPEFNIRELVYVWRTQESFLELSKYLLSDVAYALIVSDVPPGIEVVNTSYPMSSEALYLIRDHIKNKDLQETLNVPEWWKKEELKTITYQWMQKNYGKYEIKRIW